MRRHLYRASVVGTFLLWLVVLPVPAQPTPANTVITNTASASWSDANANTYVAATASASATMGAVAGVDVTSPATAAPASPSTGNELVFTITNAGNDTDQFSVSTTAGAGVTITGYRVGGTTYATLGELNTALEGTDVASGDAVSVTVFYTVAPGRGGQTIALGLTATSLTDPGTSDTATTDVSPTVSASASVTPDGATVNRLPSNGTQYTATFTVENQGNASDTFTLSAATGDAAVLAVVSVNGTAGAGGSVTVAAGGSTTVDVVYTIGDAAGGATSTLTLTATSGNDSGVSDAGTVTATVVRAALSVTKEVFEDDQTTPIGGGDTVVPGQYVWYRITVANTGGAAASTVSISDPLPEEVTYESSAPDAAGWIINNTDGTVTASLSGLLVPSGSRYFWIRVRVN